LTGGHELPTIGGEGGEQQEEREVPKNVLYRGDNLDILRRYVKDESVDLVYLDPPLRRRST
jgi:16S rRNA G966 N2-methylase RsmD